MSDSTGSWGPLEDLYQAALEREPAARDAFLEQHCADPALRAQVRTLLNAQAAGDRLLEQSALAHLARPLDRGAMFGQYRIEERIGAGGMGEVYRATDTRLRRAVAIKFLPAVYASDPELLAAFEREARLLAKFNHPHVAAIYEVEDGAIVMELIEGPTLAERIARGPMSTAEAIPLVRQIAEAVDYAHARGVIHRDLKPANIKFTDASERAVKVLDFGIAKSLESASTVSSTLPLRAVLPGTAAGTLKGTLAYMSPEQARGEGVDQRADLWAIGAVIYEMLTGKPLFACPTMTQTVEAVQHAPIDLGGIDSPLRRILEHCLVRDSRNRWRSAANLLHELDQPASRAAAAPRVSMLPWILAGVLALVAAIALFGWWRATH